MNSSAVEIGLLEVPSFRDDVYSTFVRIVFSDGPLGLDDAWVTSDPFMHLEVFARTQVATWEEAIEFLARLRGAFADKFRCSQGPLRFEIFSEQERSEMIALFDHLTQRRPGRPKGSAKRPPDPSLPSPVKDELDLLIVREFIKADAAFSAMLRSDHRQSTDSRLASAVEVFHQQTVTLTDVEHWLSQADARALRQCWLFQRFRRCQSTDYCVFQLFFHLRWHVSHRLDRLWDDRRQHDGGIPGVRISPAVEFQWLKTAIEMIPDEYLANCLIARLSPFSREALNTAFGEGPSLDELLAGNIEFRSPTLEQIETACRKLIPELKRKPRADKARETVQLIKKLWRRLAGPDAKCIVYPRIAHLNRGEKSRPYGECVDLVRDISERFGVDLPVDALKGSRENTN